MSLFAKAEARSLFVMRNDSREKARVYSDSRAAFFPLSSSSRVVLQQMGKHSANMFHVTTSENKSKTRLLSNIKISTMYVSDEGKEVIFPVYLMTIPFSYVRKKDC